MYARQQVALARLSQAILANTGLSTLMRDAVALVADTLAVAYSTIWELLPDQHMLLLRCGAGWQEEAIEGATVEAAPTSPVAAAVLGTTPAVVVDWPSEARLDQPAVLRGRGVISSLFVRIPGQARPFGSLGVDAIVSRAFGDEEISFLEAVAGLLALAIERGQAIEQRVEERTREIEQRLVAAAQEAAVLEERQRLARDLHDSVIQALYSVTLHAQGARRLLASGEVAMATDALRALQDTAQEALDEMRLLIFDLRPPILEQVGLVAALQARLTTVEGRANLRTSLIVDGVDDLPALVEQTLYRIAQEALNNALKHASAHHITVQLHQDGTAVLLEILDDGVGFDPVVAGETGGVGLRGIAERVAQMGGHVSVWSRPGEGTQLRVEITL